MLKKIFQHKLKAIFIFILIILVSYFGYTKIFKKNNEIRYVLAKVEKGTIVVSVSGSGQISAENQMDIKPKVSGNVVYLGVKNGQEVKEGTLIVQLDTKDAQKAVRDAETNLENAKLALEKLKKPPDELSLLQAEDALIQAKDYLEKLKLSQKIAYDKALEAKKNAEDNLLKAYEDGFNTVMNTFLDLPVIISGLEDILFKNTIDSNLTNIDWYVNQTDSLNRVKAELYRDNVYLNYYSVKDAYNKNFDNYKKSSRYSDSQTIESLISETIETTKGISELVKIAKSLIDLTKEVMEQKNLAIPSQVSTHQTSLESYTNTTNTRLSSLLNAKNSIETYKQAKSNAERDLQQLDKNQPIELKAAEQSIKEKEEALAKLKRGPDELDIKSAELSVKQKENALLDAKEKLADYFIRAPFDGIVANFETKKGDSISPSTIICSLITKQKIAEISLNEIDAAKVKIGQKATLTFDALPDLTLTGKVVEIDTIGTVSQGVTSYGVKISLDTDNENIKPGMSVNAEIIIEAKPDVLVVPNSAIKTQNNNRYVELIEAKEEIKNKLKIGTPIVLPKEVQIKNQVIEIGSSGETLTEVLSGIKEGDIIVSSKITQSKQINQTQRTSTFRIPGMGGQMRPR
jgi:RND family efflux transporter MFP subunit